MWGQVIDWFSNNKEWVFSGVGITVLSLISHFFYKQKPPSSQQQIKSGNNSVNIQIGRDINIDAKSEKMSNEDE